VHRQPEVEVFVVSPRYKFGVTQKENRPRSNLLPHAVTLRLLGPQNVSGTRGVKPKPSPDAMPRK